MKRVSFKKGIILLLLTLVIFNLSFSSVGADETQNSWSIEGTLPNPVAGPVVVEDNGNIYVIGGSSGATSYGYVQVYNIETKTWSVKTNMPTARSGAGYAVVNGIIYIFGGYTGNLYTYTGGSAVNTVESYDPATDKWTTRTSMPAALCAPAVASYNGDIYLFGGLTNSVTSVANVYAYNPLDDTWTAKTNMDRNIHSATAVTYNSKIYLIGGRGKDTISSSISTYQTLRVYNPIDDTWVIKSNMNVTRGGAAAAVLNDKIYAIGGVSPTTETGTTEEYNPFTDTWELKSSLNHARSGTQAVTYKDQLFVVGGSSSTGANKSVASIETLKLPIIDPSPEPTPAVTPVPTPMVTPSPTITPKPEQPTAGRAILVVTMNTGLEKEFDLSMEEINAFLNWYDARDAGKGPAKFGIDKHNNNIGPFTTRKEYVIFDKILTFSIDEYSL